jgi:voltage-gated potassium channel
MTEKENADSKQFMYGHRFLFLLILFFMMLLVGPFIKDYIRLRYLFDLVITAIFLTSIYAIVEKVRHLIITVCLAIPMLVSLWLKYFVKYGALSVIGEICGILFFAYTIFNILKYMLKQKEITQETIFAALVVYILMAFMWARVYSLLEVLEPGSFSMPEGHLISNRVIFLYYSFVTITTLGYGDISPLTDKAGGLAIIEAISGQIYMVVLVAWLVGMFVSKRSK